MHRNLNRQATWDLICSSTRENIPKEIADELIPKIPPFIQTYLLDFFEFFPADSPSSSLTAAATASEILVRYMTRCRVCGGYGHNKAGYVPCERDLKGGKPMPCGTLTRLQSRTSHNKLMQAIHNRAMDDRYFTTAAEDPFKQADGRIIGSMLTLNHIAMPDFCPVVMDKSYWSANEGSIFAGVPLTAANAHCKLPSFVTKVETEILNGELICAYRLAVETVFQKKKWKTHAAELIRLYILVRIV